jgi:probable LLM family oxidoreductase
LTRARRPGKAAAMTTVPELGLDTFGDVTLGADGTLTPHDRVLRDVVEEAVLADSVGVDFIGLGEHHRDDFAISAPEILLAAIGARTRRIRLGTAVTVLSSDDPVRVVERFATLDAISNGRAELIVGRGSFTESFPLFGYALDDYEVLFEEKLELLAELLNGGPVTWSGTTRAPLAGQRVWPPLGPGGLKVWVGVGGSPESIVRAVRHDLAVMLAIIGGDPARFRPYVELYRRACDELGRPVRPMGVHSPGHVAASDAEARAEIWPGYKALHDRDRFEAEVEHGALHVGSPETVARKIARTVETLGAARFDMKYSSGTLPHDRMMASIELYGTKVIPLVRELLA